MDMMKKPKSDETKILDYSGVTAGMIIKNTINVGNYSTVSVETSISIEGEPTEEKIAAALNIIATIQPRLEQVNTKNSIKSVNNFTKNLM